MSDKNDNEAIEAFDQFLRDRMAGPDVSPAEAADLREAFRAGALYGIRKSFETVRETMTHNEVRA